VRKDTAAIADPVISTRDLQLVFKTNDGPVHALKDVNLTIDRGVLWMCDLVVRVEGRAFIWPRKAGLRELWERKLK
jgi:hypothetical protein